MQRKKAVLVEMASASERAASPSARTELVLQEDLPTLQFSSGWDRQPSGHSFRHLCWVILISHDHEQRRWRNAAMAYVFFSCGLIVTLFTLDVMDTSQKLTNRPLYYGVEMVACIVFTAELLLRLYCCIEEKSPEDRRSDLCYRVLQLFSFLMIMDVITLVALFIDLFTIGGSTSRVLSMVRVIRVLFVVNRLNNDFRFFNIVVNVLAAKRHELLVAVMLAICLLLVSSTLMVYVEGGDPESPLSNWFIALWWASAALTTVGYGDVKPETDLGKLLAALVAFCGVGLFALPAGILASGFNEVLEKADPTKTLSAHKMAAAAAKKARASVSVTSMQTMEDEAQGSRSLFSLDEEVETVVRPVSFSPTAGTSMVAGPVLARLDNLSIEVAQLREHQRQLMETQEAMLAEQRRSNRIQEEILKRLQNGD